ncbi:MAG: hypothetical protein ACKO99_10375 [Dolichospermum sp.]
MSYFKVIITATMIGSFSLVCLVGCSAKSSNNINSDLPSSDVSSSPSFLGCWSGRPPYDGVSLVRATYVFESNNTYSVKTEIRSQHLNQNFNWKGRWERDGDYIVAVSDDDGKEVAFKILSDYELNQVGQNFNYSRC